MTAHDRCIACGHARCFHNDGTGNGVPVGKEYCDDRHSDPCLCTGFVETVAGQRAKLEARLSAARIELEALQAECEHAFAKFAECQETRTPGYINEYMPAEVVVRWWQVSCSDCGKSWKEGW